MSLWLKKKTVAPTTIIEYLGLTIDTGKMIVKIPEHKISELKDKSMFVMGNSKVTLRTLQSLAGSLAFCTKALPAGRAFF
jgi:RNA polymerase-interacting CarD/CdnL/TRCF family regulator